MEQDVVRVEWSGRKRDGHVFIAEQRDGKTAFIDPQDGSADVSWYFSIAEGRGTYLLRIDDKEITSLAEEAVQES